MNSYHQEILDEIKKLARPLPKRINLNTYLGSSHLLYCVSVPQCRRIARGWINRHKDISEKEFFHLLGCLIIGQSFEEKTMLPKLLCRYPMYIPHVTPMMFDHWLDHVEGWAEVDSLCHGLFSATLILSFWHVWKDAILRWSKDTNVHKRRASLVLLTSAVRQSEDQRLSDLAFTLIDRLKVEKEVLITKAISWLLRDLIKFHRKSVEVYIDKNRERLPKIAVREASNKLRTGKKS